MKVEELLQYIMDQTLSQSYISKNTEPLFLRAINVANWAVYSICATKAPFLQEETKLYYDENVKGFIVPNLFRILKVYDYTYKTESLKRSNNFNSNNLIEGEYIITKNKLYTRTSQLSYAIDPIDNINKRYISLVYVPNPKKLVRYDSDDENQTLELIYPSDVTYTQALINRAVEYFYSGNKVYAEKVAALNYRWEELKKELLELTHAGY